MKRNILMDDFELLFRQYYEKLCGISCQIVQDESSAEDVVQDFFYELWKKRDFLEIKGDFINYASIAVKNKSLDLIQGKLGKLVLTDDPQSLQIVAEDYNHDM